MTCLPYPMGSTLPSPRFWERGWGRGLPVLKPTTRPPDYPQRSSPPPLSLLAPVFIAPRPRLGGVLGKNSPQRRNPPSKPCVSKSLDILSLLLYNKLIAFYLSLVLVKHSSVYQAVERSARSGGTATRLFSPLALAPAVYAGQASFSPHNKIALWRSVTLALSAGGTIATTISQSRRVP